MLTPAPDTETLARFGRALADERLGHTLEHLLPAVVAVEPDKTCPNAASPGCHR
ncbi:hypothetical protein SMIR_40805 (plasmid) [Streptomyces mirabilis]|uniref:hypothetical protein n=1 Tax=Streptomyces mirabilis TaxID=68239 RepID=UPI001BAF0F78|nr:hypothetical protein [Streptomyces mirabilis]QUW85428.1 hypothetical protein SMIR_40805 [Streptomyces mirabilis]